ncbi:hypothetical protein [Marinifilum caeruleilacunae]|uniref:Uncharacterized protein n=1 Tax=Marinifilum caeruleilacunae TaxID=2499076 RepID=A0ABX1WRI1_9BACT|nr:hypothetical protein [Marinifilum caeruleilacunae]NOU58692.1 hypothetical protein [Marinifilum caeruleilacunae]
MKNKRTLTIILLAVLVLSIGSILLINNTDVLSESPENTVSLIRQYLKVLGFLSIMGLVYLRMKSVKRAENEELE